MFKLKKKKRRNKNIRGQEKKEEEAKDVTTPKAGTNAPDPNSLVPPALKRIFDCKTHFDILKLPYPEFSDGVSLWDVDETTIKKSYRKVSLRVHPDKNRKHEDVARAAFELVEKAYKELLDPALRDPYIRTHAEKGEQNKEAGWVPSAKGSSTIDQCQKDIDRQNKVERMKKNKFDTFQSRIRDKLMERIKKRKRPSSSASSHDSYYHSDDDKDDGDGKDDYGNSENESDAGGSGDSDEEEGGKSAIKRSRRHGRQSKFRRKGGAF